MLRQGWDVTWTVFRHGVGKVGSMTQVQPIKTAGVSGAHLPALDGLRGISILGVLLFHTGHLSGGFLGVDLFFALSGYLITGLLLREIATTGAVSLVAFWGRRIRRLLPALVVMLTAVAVLVWAVGSPDVVRTTLSDGPWVQLNLLNWHLLAESAGYWDRFGPDRVFEHLWSIAVEEQFYLVWPVLVLVIARRGRVGRRVAVAAASVSAVSLVLMVVLADPADPTRVYTGTDTRAFSLLLGALAATRPVQAVLARAVGRSAGAVMALLLTGIGAMWLLADGVDSRWLFTGGLFVHSLAAALLIRLCAQAPQALVAKGLAWRPLRWLGLISYSLYLWHWPVIVLLGPQLPGLGEWARTVLVFAVSIGLAALSKYLVEDPIRFRARWAAGRSGLLVFAAVMIGLAVLWLVLPAPAPAVIDITRLG
ncbi:Peptidoglycan/LPS O-acetylase OafA/YrhL, contains acyltransferase and SGNH-hydrolase domains [Saccharopolyspora kobensis]|uniref:Peptidoglycan/LPS O-acetylase OafA/YrhL, contains acyltransferase and SGNH-hydrolase domains n=2 Tax=Saccharopolyspora kobensis TaxID=146035 RepID=A0A1H5VBG4_9PSEU|nr:Peptidoglycan/LPS O-acetylase OafA/YrhL, contains acyltransferase and SGNH-hydrolase domains [Saccharopolyspora kobensis]SFC62919.1 Peptidoglycan/LPS O-acetylase OafA/YrhL, contains acyltransferase and SGNH-hydrolase domains [Saccharopolyspora kobensis]